MKTVSQELRAMDFSKDQHIFSIRKNGVHLGDIEIVNGKLTTSGFIGDRTFENFAELIWELQGFDFSFENFYH